MTPWRLSGVTNVLTAYTHRWEARRCSKWRNAVWPTTRHLVRTGLDGDIHAQLAEATLRGDCPALQQHGRGIVLLLHPRAMLVHAGILPQDL